MNRIQGLYGPIELISSEGGSLHCLQASMIMAVRALLDKRLTLSEAESLTGYVAGRETWPYEMFLSLSRMGIKVTSIEIIDPVAMASNIEGELRRVYGDGESLSAVLAITDLEVESKRAKRCVEDANVEFEVRTPSAQDVIQAITRNKLPIAAVEYGYLHGTSSTEGHFVLVSGAGDRAVEIFDPGPPGDAGREVTIEAFEEALHKPTDESGMVILLSRI